MVKRALAMLLSILVLAPSLAAAQQSKAGVVTTLEGNVTARRVALTSPVPLKFKDEVFLQDTVSTGDQSLARMLLGGKAVVTVRERSVLTITEVPGKSTLELESGKFALAVAREKMKPGEEIMIRTPNAIAGVRGTVVITEVNRQGAQVGGGVPAVLTNFYVLRGTITAQQLDPGSRQPLGTPLNVGTLQSYSGAGAAAPRVAPVPPEQVGQITSGLQPTGPKGGGESGKEQVKAQAVQTAVTLLSALTGNGNGTPGNGHSELVLAPPPPPPAPAQSNAPAPIVAISSDIEKAQQLAAEGFALTTFLDLGTLSGLNVTLASAPAVRFTGPFSSNASTPLLSLDNSTILQIGDAGFVELLNAADVFLAGGLAHIDNSTLITSGNFLRMTGASALKVGAPLLSAGGGSFVNGLSTDLRAFIAVLDGSVLTGTGTSALIAMGNLTLDSQGPIVTVRRSPSTSFPSKIALAGPLFSGAHVTINTTSLGFGSTFGTANSCCSTFSVEQGGVISSTTSLPLISLDHANVTSSDAQSGGSFFLAIDTVAGFPSSELVAPATVNLAGPLLSATSSSINPLFGLLTVQRSNLTSSSTSPLIQLVSSTVTTGGTDINGNAVFGRLLNLSSANSPFSGAASPASVQLAGPFLSASSSTINSNQLLGVFGGASFSSTTTSPLLSLSGTTLNLSTVTSGATTNRGDVVGVGGFGSSDGATFATMNLQGGLLSTTGGSLNMTGALALVFGGGQITETHPTSAFVSIANGTHSIASENTMAMFRLFGRTTVNTVEVVSTPGLATTTSNLTLGTDEPLKRSGSGAFLEASNASISTKAVMTLDNALLSATAPLLALKTSASLTSAGDALNLTAKAKFTTTGPLVKLDAATFTVTSGHAIRVLNGSFLNVGGDLVSILNNGHLNISNGAALFVSGGSVVKINGGLVNFNNGPGQLTVTNGVCSGSCSTAGGVNFFLQNGATAGNISVTNGLKNSGSATINVGLADAVIILDGASSKVIISGN
jgi:hypothetical protein